MKNRVPTVPGGGTVSYVNAREHRYVDDLEQREEGGTPVIIESIRAGLVFQLKEAVGPEMMHAPTHSLRAGIDDLPRYLEEARALFLSKEGHRDARPGAFRRISEEFDELRWFWLPEVCLSESSGYSAPP